jgi:hypothetical protein
MVRSCISLNFCFLINKMRISFWICWVRPGKMRHILVASVSTTTMLELLDVKAAKLSKESVMKQLGTVPASHSVSASKLFPLICYPSPCIPVSLYFLMTSSSSSVSHVFQHFFLPCCPTFILSRRCNENNFNPQPWDTLPSKIIIQNRWSNKSLPW